MATSTATTRIDLTSLRPLIDTSRAHPVVEPEACEIVIEAEGSQQVPRADHGRLAHTLPRRAAAVVPPPPSVRARASEPVLARAPEGSTATPIDELAEARWVATPTSETHAAPRRVRIGFVLFAMAIVVAAMVAATYLS